MMLYKPGTNGLAVTSLIFGIISYFFCAPVGGIVAVIRFIWIFVLIGGLGAFFAALGAASASPSP